MKHFVRSFSIGLFVASLIIFIFYNYFDDPVIDANDFSTEELIELVEEDGYRVITEEEYITYTVNDDEETDDKKDNDAKKDKKDDKEDKDKDEKKKDEDKDKEDDENKDIEKYTLKIKSGMTSQEVTDLLEENKIIKDSGKFGMFMDDNGYSEYIQLGEFKLKSDMTEEEVAKAISNK